MSDNGGRPLPDNSENESSLAVLVRTHADDLYRYAFRLAGNAADAEDLVQQTFVQAMTNLASLREGEKARSWLFTILRNAFFQLCRKRLPKTLTEAALEVEEIPAAMAESEIDEQLLADALDELPDEHRVVLVMFYYEELSYQQIAEQLDWPIGTVMSRLSRGKAKLRAKLASSFPEWQSDERPQQEPQKEANDWSKPSRNDPPTIVPWQ
ncbi:MAG: sigma-70 family RNA polymerase sigma factor [bacterium]|nr:sigma-70 family RNA polymerase sigma factor [bacterium]